MGRGLCNFRARYYDPQTGCCLSNDPIGIGGGLNQYAFCANNPVMFVDPEGLKELAEADLKSSAEEVYNRLEERAAVIDAIHDPAVPWTDPATIIAVNADQVIYDTVYYTDSKHDDAPATYGGVTCRRGDANCYARGMYEELRSRSLFIGYVRVYAWKVLGKTEDWPRQSELNWHDRGRELYREIAKSKSDEKRSQP